MTVPLSGRRRSRTSPAAAARVGAGGRVDGGGAGRGRGRGYVLAASAAGSSRNRISPAASSPSTPQIAASRGAPFSSDSHVHEQRPRGADQRLGLGSRHVQLHLADQFGDGLVDRIGAQCAEAARAGMSSERAQEVEDLVGVDLADHDPGGLHLHGLAEEGFDVGVVIDGKAHAERAVLECRQVVGVLDRDEAFVDETRARAARSAASTCRWRGRRR